MFVLFSLPAQAHTTAEIESWEQEWADLYQASQPDSPLAPTIFYELDQARLRFEDRHPCHYQGICPVVVVHVDEPNAPRISVSPGVEQWRGLVTAYFPASQVERALCIMWAESRGVPTAVNPSSGASGLFQFIPSTWKNMVPASLKTGSVFDPATNIAAAAWLQGAEGWTQWSPYKRGECQ